MSTTPTKSLPSFGAALLAALVPLTLAACGGGDADPGAGDPAAANDLVISGFATPESVLHDAAADVYLVSNINGGSLDKDDNGFISRVSPDGEILDLHWIDAETVGVTLNAPKGMAIQDGTLYVADIDCVRLFDAETGAHEDDICLEHATFLNDVAPGGNGTVFFTDSGFQPGPDGFAPSGADAVYRLIDDDRVVAVKKEPSLGGPDGVAVGKLGIMVVTSGSGEVYRLTAEGERTNVMPPSKRQLDGIEMLPDGGFLMSSWGDRCVYRIGSDGHVSKVVADVDAPADIGYDATRNRVMVPLFNANQVRVRPLG
jgi:hypothetical protein